jgi:aspartokinase/homoserine dehydrogenase 1
VHAERVRLFVAGTGTIGGELLRQLKTVKNEEYDLSVIGACDGQRMIWNPAGLEPESIEGLLIEGVVTDWDLIITTLINDYAYRTIFVDVTGSAEVARLYPRLLKAGIHIATPSKRANTFEQSYFDTLMEYTQGKPTHYLFETTVGAGLPVIQTIKDLIRSGDSITKVTGVVSGTMTYLFDQLQQGQPFGETLRRARQLGYAEPDPRDDLSGEDVVRKFITLTRASGIRIERSDVTVENLTPADLRSVSAEEFLSRIDDYNADWTQRLEAASAAGTVLRHVATLEHGKIHIGVSAVPASSPLASLRGTDNQIAIFTRRYNISPMIIQGPGAGKEVTSAGLLADIQKIAIRIVR